MRRLLTCLLGCLVVVGAPAVAQEVTIYRCTDAAGHLTLRDTPCAKGQTQETRSMVRPKDSAAPPTLAPAPVASAPATQPAYPVVAHAPRPLYECVTPDGDVYTSDTPEGAPRWVPLWTLGYPIGTIFPPPVRNPGGMGTGASLYPLTGNALGTWVRDICHPLPPEEVCARLLDRRDEIRRRFFNAQPSERDVLRLEERGLNARLEEDCGTY